MKNILLVIPLIISFAAFSAHHENGDHSDVKMMEHNFAYLSSYTMPAGSNADRIAKSLLENVNTLEEDGYNVCVLLRHQFGGDRAFYSYCYFDSWEQFAKINDSNDIVVASLFAPGSEVNGVSTWRHFLSTGAKFLFKFLYPFRNLNDYTCNFRAYKTELIKELLRNKTFFKNEDFNIAGKIILFLTNRFKHLKLAEVPFKLSYDYKIGDSKMNLTKTIILTLDLIFNGTHK